RRRGSVLSLDSGQGGIHGITQLLNSVCLTTDGHEDDPDCWYYPGDPVIATFAPDDRFARLRFVRALHAEKHIRVLVVEYAARLRSDPELSAKGLAAVILTAIVEHGLRVERFDNSFSEISRTVEAGRVFVTVKSFDKASQQILQTREE